MYLSHEQAEQARREDHLCTVPYPYFGLFRYSAAAAQMAGKREEQVYQYHTSYTMVLDPLGTYCPCQIILDDGSHKQTRLVKDVIGHFGSQNPQQELEYWRQETLYTINRVQILASDLIALLALPCKVYVLDQRVFEDLMMRASSSQLRLLSSSDANYGGSTD